MTDDDDGLRFHWRRRVWDSDQWVAFVRTELAPDLATRPVVITFMPCDGVGDPKYWAELGGAIMLGTPIVLAVFQDLPVPPRLEAVADRVFRFSGPVTLQAMARVHQAVEELAHASEE